MKAGQGKHRGLKLVTCICLLLIVVALLLIDWNSPATGYELSIYESLPPLVWICLIAALAGGTGIVVHQAFAGQKSKYWLLGFFVLIFAISIILLLPSFRGYFLYGSYDTIGHLGWSKDVSSEGHFWRDNRYPITHILTAQLIQVSGASPEVLGKYIPVFFTVLFMLFSYLLASSVLPKQGQALLAAASTALFFNYYHVCVYPQTLSIMLLPMLFYLYFKGLGSASLSFRVAFVITLLLFPYFHPAPAGVLIACLLGAEAAKALWRGRRGARFSPVNAGLDRITFEPTLICAVAFLTWISSYYIFHRTILNTLGWLRGEIEGLPRVEEIEQMFERQGMGIQQQVELGLKMYGDNLIYLSLSAIALIIIIWQFLRHRDEIKSLSILTMPFLISGPAWVLIFAVTLQVTLGRLLGSNIMMWATPVFAAFALYEMFGRWKRAGVIVVTCISVCASVVGILGVYHSPYIFQPNWQTTHADVQGSNWSGDHIDAEAWVSTLGEITAAPKWSSTRYSLPPHFGFPQVQTPGSLMGRDFYLLLNARFRVAPAHPVLATTMISDPLFASPDFNEADFARLEQDATVDRLYSNGGLDVMWVSGGK